MQTCNVAFCDHLQVWKRVWKMNFFCLKLRVNIWRTGRNTPTKNSLEYPPGGEAKEFMCFASPTQSNITVSLVFICCLVYSTDIRTSSWFQSSSKLVPVLKNFTYRWLDRGHDLKFFLMWWKRRSTPYFICYCCCCLCFITTFITTFCHTFTYKL